MELNCQVMLMLELSSLYLSMPSIAMLCTSSLVSIYSSLKTWPRFRCVPKCSLFEIAFSLFRNGKEEMVSKMYFHPFACDAVFIKLFYIFWTGKLVGK